jgi:hypothetical protein
LELIIGRQTEQNQKMIFFIKLVLLKKAAETMYWFEIMECTWKFTQKQQDELIWLKNETSELLAIFSTISRKSKL